MISAVIERCAGIDVGKKSLSVCVMVGPAEGEARFETRSYGTTVPELKQMQQWAAGTGLYGRDYGEHRYVLVAGIQHSGRPRPGITGQSARSEGAQRPQDRQQGRLVAGPSAAPRHGHPHFIPPRPQRELRDLTRRRRKLIQTATGEKNRVEKVLQDANVKLSNVLSDIFGVSGQLMLEALLEGEAEAAQIAGFARGSAKQKIPEIAAALEEHQMSDHHRRMIRFSLEHLRFLEEQLEAIDEQIRKKIEEAGYQRQWELLRSVPAIKENASAVLAEMGPETNPKRS